MTGAVESPVIKTASDGNGLVNAMSVDVEEYFQVSAFSAAIGEEDWQNCESRLELAMDRVLDLMERHNVRSTFFVLGWIAERHKSLIRRIADSGHEIASHGYKHVRATDQSENEFRDDVLKTRKLLEDIAGQKVTGYRAASFSFSKSNPWVHEALAECGYLYSSSIYPVHHDHYGIPDAPRFTYRPSADRGVIEFPMSTVRFFNHNFPCSGGGYFRLLPYSLSRWALRSVNERDKQPAIFYFHPWEVDADQPRMTGIGSKTKFRHYVNLGKMEGKLGKLFADFSWDRLDHVLDIGPAGSPERL